MTKTVNLHVGTPEDMGCRFIDAWKRAEQGEVVDETHRTFLDTEGLLTALTPKHRLDNLLDQFLPNHRHEDAIFGAPKGTEEW